MRLLRSLATRFYTLHAQAMLLAGILVLAATLASSGVVYLDAASASMYTQADQARTRELDLADLYAAIKSEQAGLAGYAYTHDPRFLEEDGSTAIPPLLTKIQQNAQNDDLADLGRLKVAISAWQAWATARRDALAAGAVQPEPATSLQGKYLFDDFLAVLAPVDSDASRDAADSLAAAREQSRVQAIGTAVAAVICVALLLVLVGLFIRSTLSPLRALVRTATALAGGEQLAIPWLSKRDEVGDLARALAKWREAEGNRLLLSAAMAEMSSEVDVARIIDSAVPRLLTLFGADEVVISLLEDGAPRVAVSEPHHFVTAGDALPDYSPGGRALATRHPILGDLSEPEWDSNLRRWGLGPVLSMPLVSGGQMLGVATFMRLVGERAFDSIDLHQAEVAGPFVAAAVQAARLLHTLGTTNVELERAGRLKSEFLAGMSHELRTPLNSILGFSELLMKSADPALQSERTARYLANIHQSGQHLLDMVSEILDVSKIEAGRMQLDRTPLRLAEVVEPTLLAIESLAAAKGIRVRSSVADDLQLIADPVRLRQVLLNLLSNAVKFTPGEGEVTVTAEADEDMVTISVTDTGVGIAKEDQARIFEKFEQLVNGRDKNAEGTGLGLSLSKSLVELHGGTITLDSELGAGSTFRVHLPRNLATAAAA